MTRKLLLPKVLTVVERNLKDHFDQTNEMVRKNLQRGEDLSVEHVWSQETVKAGFSGPACERVERNRGGTDNLVSFLQISPKLFAWLGYNESWSYGGVVGGARTYSFQAVSFSFYLGWENDSVKPQIFRAEWAGFAEWTKGTLGFQAKNAGHPHWQFDALESLLSEKNSQDADLFLQILKEGTDAIGPSDFSPNADDGIILDVVRAQKLSKVHFASAAAWWRPEAQKGHAHSPSSLSEIREWASQTMLYVHQELSRLKSS